jgi:hypothetical protein
MLSAAVIQSASVCCEPVYTTRKVPAKCCNPYPPGPAVQHTSDHAQDAAPTTCDCCSCADVSLLVCPVAVGRVLSQRLQEQRAALVVRLQGRSLQGASLSMAAICSYSQALVECRSDEVCIHEWDVPTTKLLPYASGGKQVSMRCQCHPDVKQWVRFCAAQACCNRHKLMRPW